jgi:hypothetical protein
MGIAFLMFFSVTHKISLFSPKIIEAGLRATALIRRRVVFSSHRILLHPVC